MKQWFKEWWQNNHPITQLELRQAIHPTEQAAADIETMLANNLECINLLTDEKFKYEMYFCAALTGLLARAGTLGGPKNNYALIDEAHAHAQFLMDEGKK